MIGCYLDESSDNSRKGIFAVGGFLGYGNDWWNVDVKWRKLREQPDIDIEYFKASECAHGHGQFEKFRKHPAYLAPQERAQLNSIYGKFVDICRRGDIIGFGFGVVLHDFYEVLSSPENCGYFPEDPYWFTYDFAMVHAATEVRKRRGPAIAFVCDEHEKYSKIAPDVYDALKANNPLAARNMGTFTKGNDKDLQPLQCADLMAYEARKYCHFWIGSSAKRTDAFANLANGHSVWSMKCADKKALLQIIADKKKQQQKLKTKATSV
ncbi:MAG: DUF3800 domain-containing protein [Terriglobales bacterium]